MKRVGKKGEGKFEKITWDEGLDIIADKLKEQKKKYGPESLAVLSPARRSYNDYFGRFLTVHGSPNYAHSGICAMQMAFASWSGDALEKYGGGGNNWNEMTYDPDSRLLYFGTAGALPYVYEKRSPNGGDNLFTSSVVAVNAETGEYAWHYQTVPQDSWEYNATMNIVLADLEINGKQRKALLIAPKNGFHYTLDRHSGELLAVGKFARTNWASDIDLETGKPVYDPAGEFWNLEEGESTYVWPNSWGAHGWHPMAYHPGTNLTYVPVVDAPGLSSSSGEGGGDFDVVSFSATQQSARVYLNDSIIVEFNQPVDPQTVFSGVYIYPSVSAGAKRAQGTYTVDGNRVIFTPNLPTDPSFTDGGFTPNTEYTICIPSPNASAVPLPVG